MGEPPAEPEIPSAQPLWALHEPRWSLPMLRAALELQVWAKLRQPKSAQELAEGEGWDTEGIRRLLDVLVAYDLLAKEHNCYRLVPIAETYLLPDKPTYMGEGLLVDMDWEGKGRLAQALQHSQRPIASHWASRQVARAYVGLSAPLRANPALGYAFCETRWRDLGVEPSEGMRVLDIACGNARMTLALAQMHSGVRLILLDWPEMLENAMAIARALGVQSQVESWPGDLHSINWGEDRFDMIWMGSILHFFSPSVILSLLQRARRALVSGGLLMAEEVTTDEERTRTRRWLEASLWLWATSPEGCVYTISEYTDFFRQAGFPQIHVLGPGEEMVPVLSARKER
jgi:ubiquinone/menaquinone biosynthesis C-methylase UbiE